MPSTILSDNGASSGTAGIKTTGSNDGQLALQTTTAGGTATTALTIDTSQNVGIGTSSPNRKLEISGGSTADSAIIRSSNSADATYYREFGRNNSSGAFEIRRAQGGAATTDFTIDTSGNTKFSGNIGIGGTAPTTSGTGITFPATQSASSDANTLDDYEEGTWTPTFTCNTPGNLNIVYATNGRQGYYTKVGRLVMIHYFISMSTFTHSTASNFIKITGLPFASATNTGMEYSTPMSEFGGITKANYSAYGFYVPSNSTEMVGQASGSAQAYDYINIADMPTGSSKILVGTFMYFTAT